MTDTLKSNIHALYRAIALLIVILLNFSLREAFASPDSTASLVYKFDIKKEIGPAIWRQTYQAIDEAEFLKAKLIVIHMNTYGGLLESADSMRTKILNCKIPIVVFIDNNAASAGALISIACNRIYMRPGANIGAATVVTMDAQALPDKYQSYMRSMMRSTAEARGRDPRIAEAMVDPIFTIPGLVDSGKVLTMTTTEAVQHGYCDGVAGSIEEVIKAEKIDNYILQEYHASFVERIIGFLVSPVISGVLILIMLGGIYYELQSPGIGFPLIAAIAAAILYFAPLYLEGLAENWEILAFVVGMVLIVLELFVLPGFGVPGVLGILLVILSLSMSMIGNDGFDFSNISGKEILVSLVIVLVSMVASLFSFFFFGKGVMHTKAFGRMVLKDEMSSSEGYVSMGSGLASLIGKDAITFTPLRPNGKIVCDGEQYSATSVTGFIEINKPVKIVKADGMMVWVREE